MAPQFENREEYEKWKAEKVREAAEAKERKRDTKTEDRDVSADSETKKSTTELFKEALTVPEPNKPTIGSSELIKCEDCGKGCQ